MKKVLIASMLMKVALLGGLALWATNADAATDGVPHSEPMAFDDCLETIGDKVDAGNLEVLNTVEEADYVMIKWEDHARKVQGTYECDARRGVMTVAEWPAEAIYRGLNQ